MAHRTHVIVFLPYCHTFPLKAFMTYISSVQFSSVVQSCPTL